MFNLVTKDATTSEALKGLMQFTPASEIELKAELGDDVPKGTVAGWASTPTLDGNRDVVVAGAFDESIKEKGLTGPTGIKFLANHDWRKVAGVIKVLETRKGKLWIVAEFNLDISYARDLYEAAKMNGGLNFSVGFRHQDYSWKEDTDGHEFLQIDKADLFEVSAVPIPMNTEAQMIFIKSADVPKTSKDTDDIVSCKTESEFEKALVAKGFVSGRNDANRVLAILKASPELLLHLGPAPVADPEPAEVTPNPVVSKNLQEASEKIANLQKLLGITKTGQ